VEAHQNVSLLIGIDGIIALVKVAIAGTCGRPIAKRALRARGRSGGALGDGRGIVHVRGAVVANIAHLLPAKVVPDLMGVWWGRPHRVRIISSFCHVTELLPLYHRRQL
jgi:hypothetical protein